MRRLRYKVDNDVTEDSEGAYHRIDRELTLEFIYTNSDGAVSRTKLKIDARDLRHLSLSTAEKWLLE